MKKYDACTIVSIVALGLVAVAVLLTPELLLQSGQVASAQYNKLRHVLIVNNSHVRANLKRGILNYIINIRRIS